MQRAAARVGNTVLWIASIAGAACIALVLLSALFHVTLIMFKTGSMSPTIPTGSLAVVREIPASEIAVGDVVTVERDGALPVTHRVTSVSGSGESRQITLRGDANAVDDPAPYDVTSVRVLLLSVPALAYAVVWMSNPLVLGAIAIAAGLLVTWSFWPHGDKPAAEPRRPAQLHPLFGQPPGASL
jgi:signal peptidase